MVYLDWAEHLKHSMRITDFKAPFTEIIAGVLERGQRSGPFRRDVDPVDLCIPFARLDTSTSESIHLGVIFGPDLITPSALQHRNTSIADMIISDPDTAGRGRAHGADQAEKRSFAPGSAMIRRVTSRII